MVAQLSTSKPESLAAPGSQTEELSQVHCIMCLCQNEQFVAASFKSWFWRRVPSIEERPIARALQLYPS